MALAQRLPDGGFAVLASTSDSPDSAGVPAGTRCEPVGAAGLAALVPAGYAVLVDGATPGRRLVSAEAVDGLQLTEQARRHVLTGLARDTRSPGTTGSGLSGPASAGILVVCLLGAGLIVAGRRADGSAGTVLQLAGWGVEALLVAAVALGASGQRQLRRGVPLLSAPGFLLVAGALLYKAVRG